MSREIKRKPAKRKMRGRPALHGTRMEARSISMPANSWRALDDEAHEERISAAELIRRRLGVKAS